MKYKVEVAIENPFQRSILMDLLAKHKIAVAEYTDIGFAFIAEDDIEDIENQLTLKYIDYTVEKM